MNECKICLLNNNLPGIILNDGICNICENFKEKINDFNFSEIKEKKNLKILKKKILKNKGSSKYDCLIGVSGGLDSTYTAFLCKKIGLNPLLVTIDNGWNEIISHNNLSNLIDYTKIDLHSVHLNWEIYK